MKPEKNICPSPDSVHNSILFLILITTVLVYWPGLSGPLLLDDIPNLYHLFRFGNDQASWKDVFELTPHAGDRPIPILSFMANLFLSPENIWQLKLTNLVIHLLCGYLIYRLGCLLLYRDTGNELRAQALSLWIVALWLLSPFLLSTVLYVIQRMAQLATLFTLCGLVFYTHGRIHLDNNKKTGAGLIITSLLVFWPLATLSKQNGILLPLLILIIEFFFFRNATYTKVIKNTRFCLIFLTCLPLIYVIANIYIFDSSLTDYSTRNFNLYERLITQPRVLVDYIANLLLIPGASSMSLFHDDYMKSTGLLHPVTTLPCLLIFILIFPLAYLTRNKKSGKIIFGVVFFYAAHLVESTFIPLELYFEHRNYLPAFGIYFSVVYGLYMILENYPFRKIAFTVLLIFPVTFSVLTFQRAQVWQKQTNVYFLSAITHPDSPRINEGLAWFHLLLNNPDESLYHLDKVMSLNPGRRPPEFYFKYLLAYCQNNTVISEKEIQSKIKITRISDNLSTINYFQMFVDAVEEGKCDALNLGIIIDQLNVAIENVRDKNKTVRSNYLLHRLEKYHNGK